ncbi:MAG TPA: BTAD domain-containing putative transcriptional regulator, partial [Candidatus Dormibacteraeota bacterium]|nr:BTAD domain-containing putative transcriptional regulator [Candidatus Dormibacteraeota bacterium]
LGCVLYESLIGVPPFQKDNDAASIYAHLAEDPPLLSARRADLPAALDAVVVTAMAKSRENRYESGAELAAAARTALGATRRTSAARTRRRASTTVIAGPPTEVPPTAPRSAPRPAPDAAETAVARPLPEPEPAERLDYRVLGPLEVRAGERELSIGTGRQRAVLARLLLDANMVVSSDRLIDALWGDHTLPESAAKALQTHVTTLRRALEPDRQKGDPSILVTRSPGYLLRVDPDDVDLGRFERLLEQGRRLRRSTPERASAVLTEAIALFRGPVLADVALEGAARAEVRRIEELRLVALEERIAADLELGREAALVGELTALVAAHPERERLKAQLTVARARTAPPVLEPELDEEDEAVEDVEDEAGEAPPPKPRRPAKVASERPPEARRGRAAPVLAAVALVAAVAAGAGLLVHSRSGGTAPTAPVSGPGPYPDAQEKSLLSRFPPFVGGCHRYADHYEKAIAEVECQPTPDHPGAKTIVYQQFANYGDLELHFHHVLALNIQSEVGKPVSASYSGACSDSGSGFFAASTYPIAGVEVQDPIASPTAHGHLFCYVGTGGVPKMAWTNVGELIVAQAVGNGTGDTAQSQLLSLWEFAGPTGSPAPVSGSPDSVVKLLYQRYLQRDPESADALNYWVDFLNTNGFARTSNAFADSSEAKTRFTLPLLRGGGHGGGTPAPTPAPSPSP